jgi:hypothetical protein
MQNGREWIFTNNIMSIERNRRSQAICETFTIYTQGLVLIQPSQIEIENKIIYDLRT